MSTIVVVTFSWYERSEVGGKVIGGSIGWIFDVTKVSFTSEVKRELLPTDSSPQIHIRTVCTSQHIHMAVKVSLAYLWPSSMVMNKFHMKSCHTAERSPLLTLYAGTAFLADSRGA